MAEAFRILTLNNVSAKGLERLPRELDGHPPARTPAACSATNSP